MYDLKLDVVARVAELNGVAPSLLCVVPTRSIKRYGLEDLSHESGSSISLWSSISRGGSV
jgi:hypothetical protein